MALGLGMCGACCGAGFSGKIKGCSIYTNTFGVPSSIDFKTGSTVILTVTSDASGNYMGTIAAGTYTQVVTPTSARMQAATFTGVVIGAAGTTIATRSLSPSTGFACTNFCPLPLRTTIQVADLHYSTNFTMAYFPTVFRWLGNHNGASFALELSGAFGTGSGGAPLAVCDLVSRACPEAPATSIVYQFNAGHGGVIWPNGSQFVITDP